MDISACAIDLQNACLEAGRRNGQIWRVDLNDIMSILTTHIDPPATEEPAADEEGEDDAQLPD